MFTVCSRSHKNITVYYENSYDGATVDSVMNRHTIEFQSAKTDLEETTLIVDCKIVTVPLVKLLLEKGFGFVSKCPTNFP